MVHNRHDAAVTKGCAMRFDAIRPGPQLSESDIDRYCDTHGLTIPPSLRQQLLDQNGGGLRGYYRVPIPGEVERYEDLSYLLGINMGDNAVEIAWNVSTLDGRIPFGMLPFAEDAGGNLYLVEVESSDEWVWFWDHEREGDASALTYVASSVAEFMSSLALD